MSTTKPIHVTPREGARIRQPNRNGRVMPADGDFISPNDMFYLRAIQSGDLIVTEEKAEAKVAPPPTAEKK